ncbi:uncharacterized protein LOC110943915 [Helianthus annuus]|uniref:uncharacterized protein LOC110943915 n=1 Tax=Helianthus annuus TaxID=4232 RepID=UPI000B8F2C4D|nr:uncharacterized protein LOC110943915 [Helianthus annuus]
MEREEGEIESPGGRPEKNNVNEDSSKNRDELSKEKAITFYVSNLHPHITDGELWTESKNYGNIVDAYIAKKLDKRRNKFGFLRFTKVKDVDKMVKALNQMTFFGWRIRVNVARFVKVTKKNQGQNKVWAEKGKEPANIIYDQPESSRNGYLRRGVSWADVAAGKSPKQEKESCLAFSNESEPLKKWNVRSVIGDLKDIEALRGVNRMKNRLGLKNSQVRYIGGLKLLIIFYSKEEMDWKLKEQEKIWDEWFTNITRWHGEEIPFERIAWLKIRGVPLQLWIDAVFECIGEKYGRVIRKSETFTNIISCSIPMLHDQTKEHHLN